MREMRVRAKVTVPVVGAVVRLRDDDGVQGIAAVDAYSRGSRRSRRRGCLNLVGDARNGALGRVLGAAFGVPPPPSMR